MRTDLKEDLISLRATTEMNRREFAEYFGIPYRTMQDWELGNRKMPEYLFRLMAYKVEMEKLKKKAKKKK
ncbi:MAG: transcriptional regulator [Lachnospiraceae bacterium]|nr:transcriptional regulator [Lachnospiraceae bacterium]